MRLTSDLHNHTPLSFCSSGDYSIEEIAQSIAQNGVTHIGFSDHYNTRAESLSAMASSVRSALPVLKGVTFYVGVEVDFFAPGQLCVPEEELAVFDYVNAACPHWHNKLVAKPLLNTPEMLAQMQYDYLLAAAHTPAIDVIVHPFTFDKAGGILEEISHVRIMSFFTQEHYARIISGLVKNNIAIELHERLRHEDYAQAIRPFLIQCRDAGVRFSIGSDAHALAHVCSVMRARAAIEALAIPETQRFLPKRYSLCAQP